jgi:hypothetical protein
MEKEFVTYEIALELKELGFNKRCFAYFNENKILNLNEHPQAFYARNDSVESWCTSIFASKKSKKNACQAPLWQQVMDWFEEKYQLNINLYKIGDKYVYTISVPYHSEIEGYGIEYFYEDSYTRRKDAVLKAIELIKKEND